MNSVFGAEGLVPMGRWVLSRRRRSRRWPHWLRGVLAFATVGVNVDVQPVRFRDSDRWKKLTVDDYQSSPDGGSCPACWLTQG